MTHAHWPSYIRTLLTALVAATLAALAMAGAPLAHGDSQFRHAPEPGPDEALEARSNAAPSARVGGHRTAVIGETVILDGTASVDLDGDRLRYAWILKAPAGSGARLSDPSSPRPNFSVDLVGDYVAELVVSDGRHESRPATVMVSTGNVPPVADAGDDLFAGIGQTVLLDASASTDFDGDGLSYRWSVVEAPAGSRSTLADARSAATGFTPDVPGDYALQLVASDGRHDSAPATVRLSTENAFPLAYAGADRVTLPGSTLRLDGHGSYDPDGSRLEHRWSILHAPSRSGARLDAADTAEPLLVVDAAGLYVVQLVVSDGLRPGSADTMVIETSAALLGQPGGIALTRNRDLPVRGGGSDIDGDGVPDAIDNCVETPNPDQIDTNGDGFGNRCDPDLDNDGLITNTIDLGLLKLAFFSTPGDANWNPDADFNGDGVVNVIELGILKFFFFNAPGPIANIFINPAGGSWHEPTNWSLGFVPNAAHAVRIDLDPGVSVEYSTGDTQISSIRTTSPLDITGGSLNITRLAEFNDDVSISGATLQNAPMVPPTVDPTAKIDISGSVTFDGVVLANDLDINLGATLTATNDLLLDDATINLLSNNSFTSLLFTGNAGATSTLGGNGEVVFSGTATVDNRNRVFVSGSTHNLTIGPGVTLRTDTTGGTVFHNSNNGTITVQGPLVANLANRVFSFSGGPLIIEDTISVSGDGRLRASFGAGGGSLAATASATLNTGELELFGDVSIDGSVDVMNGLLDLGNAFGEEWDNNGTVTVTDSTVEFGGSFDATDVGTLTGTGTVTSIINGEYDNVGQTVDFGALLPGTVELGSSGIILGGTVETTPLTLPVSQTFTFDDVTLAADLNIEAGASLTLTNDLMLSGGASITLLSNNSFTSIVVLGTGGATSTIGGSGEIVFGGTATVDNRNRLFVNSSMHGLTVGPNVTIRTTTAGGTLFHNSANGPVTLQGPVIANLANRTASVSGSPLRIEGALNVSNDSKLSANFLGTGGTFAASATATVNTGELELLGDFVIEGQIDVTNGLLDLGGPVGDDWDNNGTIVLNDSTVELGGTFGAEDVGNLTGTGPAVVSILNGLFDNTGQSVDFGTLLPGLIELGSGGSILGGTVITTPLTLPVSQTFTLDGVTLAADLDIEAGASLTLTNDLTLSGGADITLLSNNAFTSIVVTGAGGATSTIGGSGEIVFSGTATVDNRNRIFVNSSTHALTIGPNVAIRTDTAGGTIFHNNSNGQITYQGPLTANLSGRTFNFSGAPMTVEGALNVSNDSKLSGNFVGTGGSLAGSATGTVNTGELELLGDWVSDATIGVTNAVLDLGGAVGDEWDNNGTITITNSTVQAGGSFDASDVGNLSGTGTSVIDGQFDNTGQTIDLGTLLPGTLELGSGGSIVGGTVTTTPLTLGASQSFTFDGLTLATDVDVVAGASLTLTNNLVLSGNPAITLLSNNAFTSIIVTGAAGQTSTVGGTGEIVFSGTATVDNRNRIFVSGSTHELVFGPNVTIRTDTTGGNIFHNNGNGAITYQGPLTANLSDRTFNFSGAPMTVEGALNVSNDSKLSGSFVGVGGNLAASATATVNTGELEFLGDFASAATIGVTNGLIDLGGPVGDEWDNNGTITLAGSTAELGGSFDASDVGSLSGTGTSRIDGQFDNTGQTVDLGALLPGSIELGSGGSIVGGTITTTPLTLASSQSFSFDGLTLGADLDVEAGASLTLTNDLTLGGGASITLLSNNSFTSILVTGANGATSTIGGSGEIVFGGTATVDNRNRVLVTSSGHNLTVGANVAIRTDTTGGTIVHNSGSSAVITVDGTITSNVASRTVSVSGAPLDIDGTLNVGAGAVISLGSTYTLGSGANVNLDIGGTATGQFGRVTSSAAADLAGTLELSVVNGFSPMLGDTFEILTFTSRTGTFDTVTGTSIGGGLNFQVNYNATDAILEVVN